MFIQYLSVEKVTIIKNNDDAIIKQSNVCSESVDGILWCDCSVYLTIVSRGDWLGKPATIKVEISGTVGYVGSFLTVHNPLFFVHKF